MDSFRFDEKYLSQLPKTPQRGLLHKARTGQWRLPLPKAQLPA
jgi:hypothetical protein